jgi:hypothetical protein
MSEAIRRGRAREIVARDTTHLSCPLRAPHTYARAQRDWLTTSRCRYVSQSMGAGTPSVGADVTVSVESAHTVDCASTHEHSAPVPHQRRTRHSALLAYSHTPLSVGARHTQRHGARTCTRSEPVLVESTH